MVECRWLVHLSGDVVGRGATEAREDADRCRIANVVDSA